MQNQTNDADTQLLMTFVHEHWEEMRHVENQRLAIANLILVVAAGTIAFIAQKGFGQASLLLSGILIILGVYGAVSTLKLYERYHHSQSRLNHWYRKIDALNPSSDFLKLRTDADSAHELNFPKMHKFKVHWLWLSFHILIGVLGVSLSLYSIVEITKVQPKVSDGSIKNVQKGKDKKKK